MIKIGDLKDIGLTDYNIEYYISIKMIDIEEDRIIVLDETFYDMLFFKLHDNQVKFKDLLDKIEDECIKAYYAFIYAINFLSMDEVIHYMSQVDEKTYDISVFKCMIERQRLKSSSYSKYPEYLSRYIDMVDQYINRGSSVLAAPLLNNLFYYDDNLFLRTFYRLCLKLDDDMTYIVDPYIYRNPIVLEHYRSYERDLLFYLDIGNLERASYMNDILLDLYQEQKPLALVLIAAFLKKINSVKINKDEIGRRVDEVVMGDVDSVLVGLLVNNDYYRIKEVIEKKYEEERTNIKYVIYKRLIDILIKIIDKNNETFLRRVDICAFGHNQIGDFIAEYDLSSIPLSLIQAFEDKEEDPFLEEGNYFRVYEKSLAEGDLKGALFAIKKFQYLLKQMNFNVCFDYIERDLEDRIKMEEDKDNDIKEYYKYSELGDNLFLEWKYREALECYLRALKFVKTGCSSFYAKIAECYFNLGNNEAAITYYTKAWKHQLYPKDILQFIECLYIEKKYNLILELVEIYEKYYFFENPRIHYMASICEAHLGNFKGAVSELEIAEMIIKDVHQVVYRFRYERGVLKAMKKDRRIPCYTMDTYIEFELTDYERRHKEQFDEYIEYISDPVNSILHSIDDDFPNLEDKMEYLFCLLKILLMYNRQEEAKRVYNYISEILSNNEEKSSKVEHFTLILKNYRNI